MIRVTRPENDTALAAIAASRDTSLTYRSVLSGARISLVKNGPVPLQRLGPDTEGGTHPMQIHRNATRAREAPVDGLIRTRYMLVVCVACGHERIHTPRAQVCCPECGASARLSFTLFRDLTEDQR